MMKMRRLKKTQPTNITCPYCGETREYDSVKRDLYKHNFGIEHIRFHRTWYGKHDEDVYGFAPLRFWELNRKWTRDKLNCHTCHTTWLSEPYVFRNK